MIFFIFTELIFHSILHNIDLYLWVDIFYLRIHKKLEIIRPFSESDWHFGKSYKSSDEGENAESIVKILNGREKSK